MANKTPEQLQQAFGFLTVGELDFLKSLVKTLPENPVIVNIGAGPGTSTSTFLYYRRDATVYSVDKQFLSNPHGSLEGEQTALKEMGLRESEGYNFIIGDSKDVGKDWTGGAVDMVFVDGDHTYEGCRGDIEAWLPHLKIGGIMALHDFTRAEYMEVESAVADTLMDKERIGLVDTLIAFRK